MDNPWHIPSEIISSYLWKVQFRKRFSDKFWRVVVDVTNVDVEVFARTWFNETIAFIDAEKANEVTNVFILERKNKKEGR